MRIKKLQVILTVAFFTTMIFLSGCNKKVETPNINNDTSNKVEDKKYTEELQSEKEVQGGQVYIQDESIIATMIIKDSINDDNAKKLAEEYAQKLKVEYPGKKINVQAVKSTHNIANIIIDAQ